MNVWQLKFIKHLSALYAFLATLNALSSLKVTKVNDTVLHYESLLTVLNHLPLTGLEPVGLWCMASVLPDLQTPSQPQSIHCPFTKLYCVVTQV